MKLSAYKPRRYKQRSPIGTKARREERGDGNQVVSSIPANLLLAAIVDGSDDAIISKTLDGIVTSWNRAAERLYGYGQTEIIGKPVSVLAPSGRQSEMPMILERLRRGERTDHFDTVRRRKDGSLIDVSVTVSPIYAHNGRIIGASKIARDITERKQWEKQQRLLLQELSHRVKNTLAVIQSIARQSAHGSGDIGEFIAKFDGRLSAIAAAHDFLISREWRGAPLDDLARNILSRHTNGQRHRVGITVPSLWVGPSFAWNFGLVLHELASNALKFGALSTPAGTVDLTGRLEADDLLLVWREQGGPLVNAPQQKGFGTMLLEGTIHQQERGSVDLDWRPEGLICTMRLAHEPLASI